MCWSLRVSAASWAVVVAGSAALWCRNWGNDRWFAGFLLFVGQVQLLEALLWLDQGCTGLNQAASWALLAVVSLEPLAHSLVALLRTPPKLRTRGQRVLTAAAACFAAVFAAAALGAINSSGGHPAAVDWCSLPCSTSSSSGSGSTCGRHLRWGFAANLGDSWRLAFLLFLIAPWASMRPATDAALAAAYSVLTFAAAHHLFSSQAAFESMWCWLAVGGVGVALMLGRPPQYSTADHASAATKRSL